MKLYKIKDSSAVLWFIVIIYLIKLRKLELVVFLLALGALGDLIIVVTDIGNMEISI